MSSLAPLLTDLPGGVSLLDADRRLLPLTAKSGCWRRADVQVEILRANTLSIRLRASATPLRALRLRWSLRLPEETLYLGDHWERAYGDLQWRHLQPERILPWYALAHQPDKATHGFGVKTGARAFCFWTIDEDGVSLWLDLHNGAAPVHLGERELEVAEVVSQAWGPGCDPFAAATAFCQTLGPETPLRTTPVCGNNNWYYRYGAGFDADDMRRDADVLAELAGDHPVRPYCVIDAGWTPGGVTPGGPWSDGDATRFPDMPGLADDIAARGVKPGIWTRLLAWSGPAPSDWRRPGVATAAEVPLDPTHPDVLNRTLEDCARFRSWGYELIKHDFSTYDFLGRWGWEMLDGRLALGDWGLHDRSLTNAEALLGFYHAVREGSGDAVVIGCNVVGHLAAGLIEVQRIGDDTSGRSWERTRRMGVNALAFRLPQHGAFFAVDADCVAHTPATIWSQDRQFLDLVARSGTPLFVSLDPAVSTRATKAVFSEALRLALSGGEPGGIAPLDWLTHTTPERWSTGTAFKTYRWQTEEGVWPFPAP